MQRLRMPRPPVLNAILTILFVLLHVLSFAFGKVLQGKVMQVKDGDTVVIAPVEGGQFYACRLYGIDAPETGKRGKVGQPYGDDAMRKLKMLVLGQTVEVETTGAKTYNREVCILRKDNKNINLEMVRTGYAWAYVQYLKRPHVSEYIEAENTARLSRLGIWSQSNPMPPWEWRRR